MYIMQAHAVERKTRGRKADHSALCDAMATVYLTGNLATVNPLTIAFLMAVKANRDGKAAPRINVKTIGAYLSKYRNDPKFISDSEMQDAIDAAHARLKREFQQTVSGVNVPHYTWEFDRTDGREVIVKADRIVPSADELSAMQAACKDYLANWPANPPTFKRV